MHLSRLPPQYWLALATLACLCGAILATVMALQIVVPEHRPERVGERIHVTGKPVSAFQVGPAEQIEADPILIAEEPDILPNWAQFNRFMAQQSALAAALADGTLEVIFDDGQRLLLAPVTRHLAALPPTYWMQVAFGLGGLLLGASIWAFRPDDPATRLYALTGAFFAIAALTAAVYSTRELALGADTFRQLSRLNHFGTIAFAAALLGLLWHYPRRLARLPIVPVAFVVAAAFWIGDSGQLTAKAFTGMQTGVFVLFLPCFIVAALQWRRHARSPVDRMALLWFLMSVFSGTLLFAGLVLAPPLFGAAPLAEQSAMLGVFLLIYAGIAAALTRYRLFDIERWWFNAWLWFLGGLAIVALDALLLMALPIAGATAALFAVAIIGWLYFPARQWLWRRLLPDRRDRTAALLPGFINRLAGARGASDIPHLWRQQLQEAFQPLTLTTPATPPAETHLSAHGQTLTIAGSEYLPALQLQHPGGGARLFSREDLTLARALWLLADQGARTIALRQREVDDERQRIMRDLHDDLGSKLLAISHGGDAATQSLARAAFQDLRDILRALDAGPTTLGALAGQCRFELQSRAEQHGLQLNFHGPEHQLESMLTARQATNLARLLREALTNAIRHAGAQQVAVRWDDSHAGRLKLSLAHDGQLSDPDRWQEGHGLRAQRARADDLGGSLTVTVDGDPLRCRTHICVPLSG